MQVAHYIVLSEDMYIINTMLTWSTISEFGNTDTDFNVI